MPISKQVVPITRIPTMGAYSHAVRAGDFLFIAGQAGIDPVTGQVAGPTFEAQGRQALTNLRTVLEEAGSSLAHVVKTTCFLADPAAFADLNVLFAEFFPDQPPVRSAPVVALPRGLLFSIEAIAVMGA